MNEIRSLFDALAEKVTALGGDPERVAAFHSHLATARMHADELAPHRVTDAPTPAPAE